MRVHRIKEKNLQKVSDEMSKRKIQFEVVPAPLSDSAYYEADGWYGEQYNKQVIDNDLKGMIGIQCELSGKKFHLLLVDLGIVTK